MPKLWAGVLMSDELILMATVIVTDEGLIELRFTDADFTISLSPWQAEQMVLILQQSIFDANEKGGD